MLIVVGVCVLLIIVIVLFFLVIGLFGGEDGSCCGVIGLVKGGMISF